MEDHKKILYKVCNSYCKNPGDRDDLAQEIIVQLWRSSATFDGRARFSTWMYRIALNVAISFYRRASVRSRHVISGNEQLVEVADESASRSEEVQDLYQWIERLDPLNKALALLYLDGNNYQEIAEVPGISETNAATKISRLKQTLRQEVGVKQHGTR
jgi:RNA polymerase sigma factor (sigma-70 family)